VYFFNDYSENVVGTDATSTKRPANDEATGDTTKKRQTTTGNNKYYNPLIDRGNGNKIASTRVKATKKQNNILQSGAYGSQVPNNQATIKKKDKGKEIDQHAVNNDHIAAYRLALEEAHIFYETVPVHVRKELKTQAGQNSELLAMYHSFLESQKMRKKVSSSSDRATRTSLKGPLNGGL